MPIKSDLPRRIEVVDSHTAGEPTRCVISGGPDLGDGSIAERLARMRRAHDVYRRAILLEPRGSDVLVGALLVEPVSREAAAGVIFFNNAGYLGMCGHGTIGVAATLAYMGRIGIGRTLLRNTGRRRAGIAGRKWRSHRRQRGRISLPRARAGRCAGVRSGAWRCGLGRQLVLPC